MRGGGGGSSSSSRYEPIAPIGTGGMATVFVARTRGGAVGSSRFVALKRAHSHVKNDEKLAASMKLEAHLASRLHHANVVSVLDVEEDDGDLVLVLDYVEGCTLRTLTLKLDKLGEHRPREILRIVLDVAAGLHAAHQTTDEHGRLLGLVHRDVSPSNILVGADGVTRIADFGIAKAIVEGSDRTETGILKGKSSYMAPEYVMHQRASAASDLFSLGVVTWEALAGERLFKGHNEIETLKRVMAADVRPLTATRPELASIDHVLARALARSPSDRYASVDEMASELEGIARAHDLVATHAEVSVLVERVARVELEERRRLLRNGQEDIETVVASSPLLRALAGRDEIAPASQPVPSSKPAASRGSTARVSVSRASAARVSTAQHVSAPRVSAAHASVSSSSRMPVSTASSSSRMSARHPIATPRPTPVPPMAVLTAAAAAAAASQSQEAQQPRPPKREANPSRKRELLALAGAFVLLGIALTVMAIELAQPSDDETPVPAASSPAAPASSTTAAASASVSASPEPSTAPSDSHAAAVNEAPSASASSSASARPGHLRRPPNTTKAPPNPQGSAH